MRMASCCSGIPIYPKPYLGIRFIFYMCELGQGLSDLESICQVVVPEAAIAVL